MHKLYKLDSDGVGATETGSRVLSSDCPIKAPQITLHWGAIVAESERDDVVFDEGTIVRHESTYLFPLLGRNRPPPPYWDVKLLWDEPTMTVVGLKWTRKVPWEYDTLTHKEQELQCASESKQIDPA